MHQTASQQIHRSGVSRKTLLISAAAIISVLIGGIALYFALSGSKFNPYKGPLSELVPQKIGNFELLQKKEISGEQAKAMHEGPGRPSDEELGFTDALSALYMIPGSQNGFSLHIVRYPSSSRANEVLKVPKEHYCPSVRIKEEGPKEKDGSVVGSRLVVECPGNGPGAAIFWTNGSVVFSLKGGSLSDMLDVEKKLPY